MFSLDNVVLPTILLGKLAFLQEYNVSFGEFIDAIGGDYYTPIWLVVAFVLTLLCKNSLQLLESFKPSATTALFVCFVFVYSLFCMYEVSEFLYFNF